MKTFRLLVAAVLLFAFLAQLTPVHAQSCTTQSGWYVASLDGTIDPGASDFLSSAINNAESACAGNFVFVLNTFGGDGNSMDEMVKTISSYQAWGGNFSTLIAPPGAHAFSAGAYISEASNRIYMTAETTIGSATPIVSGIPTGEENTTLRKDINGFTAYMQALTSGFGRNATATGLMVTQGVSYTSDVAYRLHVVDGVVSSRTLDGALSALGVPSGTPIDTPGIRQQLISLLSDPNVSGLLFLVGVFAVLADIYHPTIVLSVVGIVIIALALFGLGLFGASALSISLMIIGAAFIFLEVKTQHGISAVIGVIIFAVGFLLVFQTPPPPAQPSPTQPPSANFFAIPDVTYILLGVLGGLVVVGSVYLMKLREGLMRRPKHFDMSRMVGKEGRLESDISAGRRGVANIESEQWTVTSPKDIEKGARVRVIGVVGLELIVEKAPG